MRLKKKCSFDVQSKSKCISLETSHGRKLIEKCFAVYCLINSSLCSVKKMGCILLLADLAIMKQYLHDQAMNT